MADPANVARLCERLAEVLQGAPDHEAARQALVAVLARWVAVGALQDGDPDHWAAYMLATTELHVATMSAFDRLRAGWGERN